MSTTLSVDIPIINWRAPVSTTGALPTTGNVLGDARVVLADYGVYVWDGSAWHTSSGGGGSGNSFTTIQTDAGTYPTAGSSTDTLDLTSTDLTITGNASTKTVTFALPTVPIAKGGTNSTTSLNNNRVIQSSGGKIVEAANITAARTLISDANGIPTHSAVTSTTLAFLDATSSVQTQLNLLAPKASPAFTTQVTFGNYHLEPSENNAGNSSTALTIDWSTGAAQKVTLTGACTFTFSNGVAGGAYVLKLVQDGTGSRTATWPAAVKWPNATAPTLTTTAGQVDLVNFYYDGTDWFGSFSLNYTP